MSVLNKIKTNTLIKDYLITASLNVITSFCFIIIFKILNSKFNAESVYVFSIFNRIMSFLSPIALLGMGITLARNVSSKSSKSNSTKLKYLKFTTTCITVLPLVFILVNFLFPAFVTKLLWGDAKIDYKVSFYLFLYIWGLTNVSLLISYFRGVNNYLLSSLINFLILGLLPVVVIFFVSSFLSFLLYSSLLILLISIGYIIYLITLKKENEFPDHDEPFNKTKVFWEGSSRVVGDFSFYLLLFIPSFLVIHFYNDLKSAAAFSIALTLVGVILTFIQPLSFITLTRAVKLKEDDNHKLRKEANMVFKIILVLGVLAFLFIWFFLQFIIGFFFTKDLLDKLFYIKLFLISLPFYISFMSCRSYIDGSTAKPIIPIFTTIALFTFLIVFFATYFVLQGPYYPVIISFFASSLVLFSLTFWYIKFKL